MKNSVILGTFITMLQTLMLWYNNSFIARIIDTCYGFVAKTVLTSIPGRYFTAKPKDEQYFRGSVLYKLLRNIYYWFKKPAVFLEAFKEQIKRGSKLHNITENLLNISIRAYGEVLFVAGLVCFLLCFVISGDVANIKGIVSLIMFVTGAVFIIINRSMVNIASSSYVIKFINSFFQDVSWVDTDNKLYLHEQEYKLQYMGLTVIMGLIAGACLYLFSISHFVLIAGAVIGSVLVLKYVEAGLFIFIVGAPILPTMSLVGLILLCVISLIIKVMTNTRFHLRVNGFDVFVLFFMGAILYGAFGSFAFFDSLKMAMVYLAFMMGYFVMTNTITSKRRWKIFVGGFLFSAVLVALYGIFQNYFGVSSTESWLDEGMFTDIKVRVYSTLGNPNVLGEFLVVSITTCIGLLWAEKWSKKPWYALMLMLMAVCLLFTWSRGAWLGVVAAIFIFAAIKSKSFTVLVIFGIILMPFVAGDVIMSRIGSVGNMQDTSTAYRVSIWISSIRMLKEFWVSGIGLGSATFASIYSSYAQQGASFALHSHNTFLQIALSMGIMGIGLFIIMMIKYFRNVYSAVCCSTGKNKMFIVTIALAMSCGIIGYLIQGMTDNVWYNYKMFCIFWIVMGFTISGLKIADKEQ